MTKNKLTKEEVRNWLENLRNAGKTWRDIGLLLDLPFVDLYRFYNGKKPSTTLCRHFGWLERIDVYIIEGQVPESTQVLGAQNCVGCGAFFISNNHFRRWCFLCSPKGASK